MLLNFMDKKNDENLSSISYDICRLLIENYKLTKKAKENILSQEYIKVADLQNEINSNIHTIRELQIKAFGLEEYLKKSESRICYQHIESLQQTVDISKDSLLRQYSVIPGKLYAGDSPSSDDEELTTIKLAELIKLGVTKIIIITDENDFIEEGVSLCNYEDLIEKNKKLKSSGIKLEKLSITNVALPSIEKMKSILKTIIDFVDSNETVYIHSNESIDITTLIIGCFIIETGITQNNQALFYVDYLRRNTNCKSLEPIEQFNFVKSWGAQ
jgi:hypothetical protein